MRDITGNEIKKIANNSNPNCHGHIARQIAIRSRAGGHGGKRKREIKRQRGGRNGERKRVRERARARETTLQLLISMHHLSILAPASLIDFHSAGCMAARYPGAIFNHLAFVDSYLWGARKIAAGRNARWELLTRLLKLMRSKWNGIVSSGPNLVHYFEMLIA